MPPILAKPILGKSSGVGSSLPPSSFVPVGFTPLSESSVTVTPGIGIPSGSKGVPIVVARFINVIPPDKLGSTSTVISTINDCPGSIISVIAGTNKSAIPA